MLKDDAPTLHHPANLFILVEIWVLGRKEQMITIIFLIIELFSKAMCPVVWSLSHYAGDHTHQLCINVIIQKKFLLICSVLVLQGDKWTQKMLGSC